MLVRTDAGEEEERGGVGVRVDYREDVLGGDVHGFRVGVDFHEGGRRGEPVQLDLGGDCVLHSGLVRDIHSEGWLGCNVQNRWGKASTRQ